MSDVIAEMQAVLVAALDGLVPATSIMAYRVPQDAVLPYVVHQPINCASLPTSGGAVNLRQWADYQVDVYAASSPEVVGIVGAIRAGLRHKITGAGAHIKLQREYGAAPERLDNGAMAFRHVLSCYIAESL